MNTVYLLLGSNLEDRLAMLGRARSEIEGKIGRIVEKSSVYESEPWGFRAELSFLNQVVKIETDLDPTKVLHEILFIEKALGRRRFGGVGYASRLIDIDILFFNNDIIREDNLEIPHPGIPDRMFTLLPLNEISRSLVHPVIGKTMEELIAECTDKLKVYLYRTS